MKWIVSHFFNILSGLLVAIFGYFTEVKGVVNVMVFAILLDLLLGIWAARTRGEGIQSKKLWRTIYKLAISVAVVLLFYAADREIGLIQMHKAIALLVVGFEGWSMLESAGEITDHKLFRLLKTLMEDKIQQTTGIKISKDD